MALEQALERGRLRLEATFLDECVITRDPDGQAGRTFDRTTMNWSDDSADVETLYRGPCALRASSTQPRDDPEGTEPAVEERPTISIPIGSSSRIDGLCVVKMTKTRVPQLRNTRYRVLSVEMGTYAVAKKLNVVRVLPVATVNPDG